MSSSAAATVIAAVAAAAAAAAGTNNPVANNRSSSQANSTGSANRPNGANGLSRQIKFHEYKGPPAARRGSTSPAKQQQQAAAAAAKSHSRHQKGSANETNFQQKDTAQQQVVVHQQQQQPTLATKVTAGASSAPIKRSNGSKLMYLPASSHARVTSFVSTETTTATNTSPTTSNNLQQLTSASSNAQIQQQQQQQQLTSGSLRSEDGPIATPTSCSNIVLVERQHQQQSICRANGLVGQAQKQQQQFQVEHSTSFGVISAELNGADVTGGGVLERSSIATSAPSAESAQPSSLGAAVASKDTNFSTAATPISLLTPISVVMQLHHLHPQQQQLQSNHHHQQRRPQTVVESGVLSRCNGVQVQAISQSSQQPSISSNSTAPTTTTSSTIAMQQTATHLANDQMYRSAQSESFATNANVIANATHTFNALPSTAPLGYISNSSGEQIHRNGTRAHIVSQPNANTTTTTTMTPTSQTTPIQSASTPSLQEARDCVAAIVCGPNSEQNDASSSLHHQIDALSNSSADATMQLNHRMLNHPPSGTQQISVCDNGFVPFVSSGNDAKSLQQQQQLLQQQQQQQQHASLMDEVAMLHQNCSNQNLSTINALSQYSPDNNNSFQFCSNTYAMDSCDQLEPTIGFPNGQFDELLFSEFIDLQDVPMNVDESDWLRKFLPPCSM